MQFEFVCVTSISFSDLGSFVLRGTLTYSYVTESRNKKTEVEVSNFGCTSQTEGFAVQRIHRKLME